MHRESRQTQTRRLVVIVVVLALHLAILSLLILSSKTRLSFPAARRIELIYLPSIVVPRGPLPKSAAKKNEKRFARADMVTTSPPLMQSLDVIVLSDDAYLAPPIDWVQQAQSVASDIASRGVTPRASDPVSKSPFALAPAHHAGEEFVTTGGDRAVFISEHCYQVAKTFADLTNGIANGMGTQTYCIQQSNKARGDLFDQLPSYKKRHPEPVSLK